MAWSLEDKVTKDDLKRDKDRDKVNSQRSVMKVVGENMASFGCMLIVFMLVGLVWTDMRLQLFSEKMALDGVITITMFIIAEYLMSRNGVKCGKRYDEYIVNHEKYLLLRTEVFSRGVSMMHTFCDWRVDVEYEYYIRQKCKQLKLDYNEYVEKYSKSDLKALKEHFPKNMALRVFALNQTKPIELTPDILLTDGKVRITQGGVGESGEGYAERKTIGKSHVILAFITGFISVAPSFFLHEGASWELVIYTLFKLVMLTFRMYSGFQSGAKAFNTIEVSHLQAKIKYLNLYLEFLNKKLYKRLTKYHDVFTLAMSEEEVIEYSLEANHDSNTSDSGGGRIEAEHGVGRAEDTVGVSTGVPNCRDDGGGIPEI